MESKSPRTSDTLYPDWDALSAHPSNQNMTAPSTNPARMVSEGGSPLHHTRARTRSPLPLGDSAIYHKVDIVEFDCRVDHDSANMNADIG